jgi:SAM-dependent methyltransferase
MTGDASTSTRREDDVTKGFVPRAARDDDPHGGGSPFGQPRGVLGWLAGLLMARVNAEINTAALEVLAPAPEDRVLEIGFGHGRTVAQLATRAGFVAGIDPAAVLVRQARLHNRAALRSGRVDIQEASVSCIPYPDESFTKVLAVNCYQHWPEPAASLREVARVLRPGGVLVLGLRLHDPDASLWTGPGFQPAEVDDAERALRTGGFSVRREHRRAGRDLTCLVASLPTSG